ncbi:hypothetical protein BDZ89DRAFT_1071825 [Hymenopellis radicata]|nr:hypothetical protein BDZ89DRAFT_1071825 [Hymenopellis radicata]
MVTESLSAPLTAPPLPVSIEQYLVTNEAPRLADISILHDCLPPLGASLTRLDEPLFRLCKTSSV